MEKEKDNHPETLGASCLKSNNAFTDHTIPSRKEPRFMGFSEALIHMKQGRGICRKPFEWPMFWIKDAVLQYSDSQGYMKAMPVGGVLVVRVNSTLQILTIDIQMLNATDYYLYD